MRLTSLVVKRTIYCNKYESKLGRLCGLSSIGECNAILNTKERSYEKAYCKIRRVHTRSGAYSDLEYFTDISINIARVTILLLPYTKRPPLGSLQIIRLTCLR